jgi:hypothetical protein
MQLFPFVTNSEAQQQKSGNEDKQILVGLTPVADPIFLGFPIFAFNSLL